MTDVYSFASFSRKRAETYTILQLCSVHGRIGSGVSPALYQLVQNLPFPVERYGPEITDYQPTFPSISIHEKYYLIKIYCVFHDNKVNLINVTRDAKCL